MNFTVGFKKVFVRLMFALAAASLAGCSGGGGSGSEGSSGPSNTQNQPPAPEPVPDPISLEPAPQLLSATNLFSDVSALRPSALLNSFEVIQPLWSDYAEKSRWFYVPEGEQIGFNATGAWEFPVGSVMVKLFEMETSPGNLEPVEMRVMILRPSVDGAAPAWDAFTYVFNDDASDASLELDGDSFVVSATPNAANSPIDIQYNVPSQSQCFQCHNSSVGFIRGLKTRQTNFSPFGVNQIESWADDELLDETPVVADLDAFVNVNDASVIDDEKKAMSYLSVNCAHCHNSNGGTCFTATRNFDFRYDQFSFGNYGPGSFVGPIDSGFMPRFSNIVDQRGANVVADWLLSL